MENLTFAGILVMTDSKKAHPDFSSWLRKAISNFELKEKFCASKCSFKNISIDEFPCKKLQIFHAAHLPGTYDYIIEMLCSNIGVLELFVNQCLRTESDIADMIKDTYTYVGVPVVKLKSSMHNKEGVQGISAGETPPW
jgi:hypothetical protein